MAAHGAVYCRLRTFTILAVIAVHRRHVGQVSWRSGFALYQRTITPIDFAPPNLNSSDAHLLHDVPQQLHPHTALKGNGERLECRAYGSRDIGRELRVLVTCFAVRDNV